MLSVDYIRVQGCKVHLYIERESIPQSFRKDKLIDKVREGVFLRYVVDTSKQFLIQALDRKDIIKLGNVMFYENKVGGDINLNFTSKHALSTTLNRNL